MIHVLTDIKELRDEIAGLRGMLAKQDNAISDLNLTIAELRRRLAYYENPHSPPSKNSIPHPKKRF